MGLHWLNTLILTRDGGSLQMVDYPFKTVSDMRQYQNRIGTFFPNHLFFEFNRMTQVIRGDKGCKDWISFDNNTKKFKPEHDLKYPTNTKRLFLLDYFHNAFFEIDKEGRTNYVAKVCRTHSSSGDDYQASLWNCQELKDLWEEYHNKVHKLRSVPCDEECSVDEFLKWLERKR